MSEDTFNEKKFIELKVKLVKEYEKICIQEQIILLYSIRKKIGQTLPFPAAPAWDLINNEITLLTNKLNQLK